VITVPPPWVQAARLALAALQQRLPNCSFSLTALLSVATCNFLFTLPILVLWEACVCNLATAVCVPLMAPSLLCPAETKGRVTGASGATTTVALVHPQRGVFASLGDSLAVLCRCA
jgi:hypothetical protein